MAWEEVAGDAVKIGLGALIGAVASYLAAKRSAQTHLEVAHFHRQSDFEKDRSTKQEELVGQIALNVESFHRDFMRYVQLIDVDGDISFVRSQLTRDRIAENRRHRVEAGPDAVATARQAAKESNDSLVHPRIYIRLLRDPDLLRSFQAFERAAEILWIESGRRGVGILGPSQYEELLGKYSDARDHLRDELARVFPLRLDLGRAPG